MIKIITNFIDTHYYIVFIFMIIVLILVLLLLRKIYLYFHGNFGEGNIYKRLRRLYNEYDYPFIKQIILSYNNKSYAYYDAIVFGDYYIYVFDIKNHHTTLKIDPIDYWQFQEKDEIITIINPFYELEIKKHILRRYLEVDAYRIIDVVIINDKTKVVGQKGNHHLIKPSQITSLIRHYEQEATVSKMNPKFIEKIGNNILTINQKKNRRKIINNIKNQRVKE
ncbi:MAG: NERD domain-containing protein [Bacilli bacterium]|jgi:hypothetical protein|nr:NERD domain-containing protein [Bacilli bacterium]